MATSWSTPATFVASTMGTAAQMNLNVRDNTSWLGNDAPYCRVYRSTNQSIASGGSGAAITFDTDILDQPGTMHSTSTNTSRITIPSGMGGVYAMGGSVEFDVHATGARYALIQLNGTGHLVREQDPTSSASAGTDLSPSTIYRLAAGDYIELIAFQNSGVGLNVVASNPRSPQLWCHWIRN